MKEQIEIIDTIREWAIKNNEISSKMLGYLWQLTLELEIKLKNNETN